MDLFSFLDPTSNNEEPQDIEVDVPERVVQKRKEPAADAEGEAGPSSANGFEPVTKRPRIEAAPDIKPVLLDDFETEAKREVAASASLQASDESGSRLELRHQVSLILDYAQGSPLTKL
jgi:ATP-dependent RNA helicase DOB1